MAKKDPLAAAFALLKEAGVELKEKPIIGAHNYRNGDAVVVFANLPAHFRPGICKTCGKAFATNKPSVGFCTDICRREDWLKTTGVEWAAVSTHDVWNGDPPMIVTPTQLANLKRIAEWFNKNQKDLEITVEPESVQEPLAPLTEVSQEDYSARVLGIRTPEPEPELWEDLPSDLPTTPHVSQSVATPVETSEVDDLFGF